MAAIHLLLAILASLLSLAASQTSDLYSTYGGFSGPYSWSNQPAAREGTVYGNDPTSQYVYFAGGVELISLSQPNQVFTDVWVIDYANQRFIQTGVNLPSGSYFGVGGWGTTTQSLWVHTGRNNVGTGSNTYWSGLVRINFPSSNPTQATLSNVTLSIAVDPRQYASSIIFTPAGGVETMYVFGGLNGGDGFAYPTYNFYSIALSGNNVGLVTPLTQTGNVPVSATGVNITSNPTLFVSPSSFNYIYSYGGLDASGGVFADNTKVFIYSIASNTWLTPTSPARSTYSAVSFNPYIVYSGTIFSADFTQLILLGGDYGSGNSAVNEVNGSHANIFHFDLTPLAANPTTGQPYLAQYNYVLPYRVESPVSAFVNGSTIVSWSGSQYVDEFQNDAAAYVNGLVISPKVNGASHAAASCGVLATLAGALIALVAVLI